MSTPSDGARPVLYRPVVQKHRHTNAGYIAVMTDKPNPADDDNDETLRWVNIADYDALRAEVERLQEWRRDLCERLGFDCAAGAEWDAAYVAADQQKQIAAVASLSDENRIRAEAAEAELTNLRKLHSAALNEGDGQ